MNFSPREPGFTRLNLKKTPHFVTNNTQDNTGTVFFFKDSLIFNEW